MFRRALSVLGLSLASALAVFAQTPAAPPVHSVVVHADGRGARLWLVFFPEKDFYIRIIDNAAPANAERYKTMDVPLRAAGAFAGANGSFFNREPFDPVGLMISESRTTGRFDPQSWMKGLLVVRGTRLALETSDKFQPDEPGITGAIQSGPWLVREGRPEADNNATHPAPRTFIGHDGKGVWFLGVSNDCSLHHLSQFLRSDAVRAITDVSWALNLDGGPSTGLWVKGSPRDFYRQEKWPVRNYLAVVAKPETTTKE